MMKKRIYKNFLFLIGFLILTLFFVKSFAQNSATVIVDLSQKPQNVQSVAGFLHSTQLSKLSKDIDLLKPGYWRVGWSFSKNRRNEILQEFQKKDIKPILVVSDLYDYQRENLNWVKPFNDPSRLKKITSDIYSQYGNSFIYDIWNEPNLKSFWKESRQDFFKTFKIAYDQIRSMPGGDKALIMGPSTAGFDKEFIEEFLKYCSENKMRIDYLAWHENGDVGNALLMEKRINFAKENWFSKYSSIGLKKIFIPEIIDAKNQYNPLAPIAYLTKLEENNATGGCKSCWRENCGDNSMNGILTSDYKPRSIWWAYKWYAESLNARLVSESSSKNIVTIAYIQNQNLNVIVGNLSSSAQTDLKVLLNKTTQNKLFSKKTSVSYTIYKLPKTEMKVLDSPLVLYRSKAKITNNQITVNLENIANDGVYLLSFKL